MKPKKANSIFVPQVLDPRYYAAAMKQNLAIARKYGKDGRKIV